MYNNNLLIKTNIKPRKIISHCLGAVPSRERNSDQTRYVETL